MKIFVFLFLSKMHFSYKIFGSFLGHQHPSPDCNIKFTHIVCSPIKLPILIKLILKLSCIIN